MVMSAGNACAHHHERLGLLEQLGDPAGSFFLGGVLEGFQAGESPGFAFALALQVDFEGVLLLDDLAFGVTEGQGVGAANAVGLQTVDFEELAGFDFDVVNAEGGLDGGGDGELSGEFSLGLAELEGDRLFHQRAIGQIAPTGGEREGNETNEHDSRKTANGLF